MRHNITDVEALFDFVHKFHMMTVLLLPLSAEGEQQNSFVELPKCSEIPREYQDVTCVGNGLITLRPGQDGQHFSEDIFQYIFFNENVWILIKISLKFVFNGPTNNIPALGQIMAWRRPGAKPLSEPMMV